MGNPAESHVQNPPIYHSFFEFYVYIKNKSGNRAVVSDVSFQPIPTSIFITP